MPHSDRFLDGRTALLTTQQASVFLSVSPRTLEDWRLRGGGPLFRRIGRRLVRYALNDLNAFIEIGACLNTGQSQGGAA
jgi:hypothetical protein